MALDINIRITSDGEGAYSAHEQSILSALAAHPSQGAAAEWPPVERTVSRVVAPPEVTPAAAPAVKKPAARAPKAAAKKPTPEPDVPMALDDAADAPAVEEEEVPGDPQVDAVAAPATDLVAEAFGIKLKQPVQRTLDGAVTVVTELVGAGKIAPAKAALDAAGVKKVSALESDEQVAAFFAALEV